MKASSHPAEEQAQCPTLWLWADGRRSKNLWAFSLAGISSYGDLFFPWGFFRGQVLG